MLLAKTSDQIPHEGGREVGGGRVEGNGRFVGEGGGSDRYPKSTGKRGSGGLRSFARLRKILKFLCRQS